MISPAHVKSKPAALVITAAGINCDLELAHAFELAGADAVEMHLNQLIREPEALDHADLIGLPGGFSFGDAVGAGRIAAAIMRNTLWQALISAVERGVAIIAPCNGFQIAVQLGLLPGPIGDQDASASESAGTHAGDAARAATPPQPCAALANNASARFVDRWCRIEIPSHTRCIWTRGLEPSPDAALLPIAHGEGRFIVQDPTLIGRLDRAGQIAVRYAPDDNPNGSMADIAGICDSTGLVLGIMPHPERFTSWTQHPWWTRLDRAVMRDEEPLGLRMFRNAVEVARQNLAGAAEPHHSQQHDRAPAHLA